MTTAVRILLLAAALCAGANAVAQQMRVALKGYDPVAYFTEHQPAKGDPRYVYDFDDSRYHFASARHRELFAADPERYAPRYSGYCTGAVLGGMRYEADPRQWAIVDGKLYLFSSPRGKEQMLRNPAALAAADKAWQSMK